MEKHKTQNKYIFDSNGILNLEFMWLANTTNGVLFW